MSTESDRLKVSVFNGSSNKLQYVTMGGLVDLGKKLCWDTPLNDTLWYRTAQVFFYQFLPALLVDGLLLVLGRKPMLVKVIRRIFIANCAMQYFLLNEWVFNNSKLLALENLLLPEDKQSFSYQKDHELTQPMAFFTAGLMGARRYLLNEPDSTMAQAKVHSRSI
ncbi:hypothetical protein NQ318_002178 [Aromia moschata]|uniref:Fatty acyl-CoA reductase C-terminal domain-containing protein n=1 Tax=Aromia moschata TaxID=1265417 RepID=A0AAV8Z4T4_9CUCU|nr:hypothetical protein NQ318_002178 [Aromia moschata]